MKDPAKPLAYKVAEACAVAGFGPTTAYALIAKGILDARKVGRSTVILAGSLDAFVASLPKANIRAPSNRKAA